MTAGGPVAVRAFRALAGRLRARRQQEDAEVLQFPRLSGGAVRS